MDIFKLLCLILLTMMLILFSFILAVNQNLFNLFIFLGDHAQCCLGLFLTLCSEIYLWGLGGCIGCWGSNLGWLWARTVEVLIALVSTGTYFYTTRIQLPKIKTTRQKLHSMLTINSLFILDYSITNDTVVTKDSYWPRILKKSR